MNETSVETQCFYFTADNGHIGLVQLLYSNVMYAFSLLVLATPYTNTPQGRQDNLPIQFQDFLPRRHERLVQRSPRQPPLRPQETQLLRQQRLRRAFRGWEYLHDKVIAQHKEYSGYQDDQGGSWIHGRQGWYFVLWHQPAEAVGLHVSLLLAALQCGG